MLKIFYLYPNLSQKYQRLSLLSGMTNQEDAVINTSRQFFLIMGHHNHSLVFSLAECLYDIFHQPTIHIVKSMKWLIKDKNSGSFTKARANKTRRCSPLESLRKPASSFPSNPKTFIQKRQIAKSSSLGLT